MIRRAQASDMEIIANYNCKMAMETEGLNLDKEVVLKGVENALKDNSKAIYFLYQVQDRVVGQLMVTKEWSDWRNGDIWWIQSVYVHRAYRRQGIFSQLYNYVKQITVNDPQVCGIRLYVEKANKTAQVTYKNLGMSVSNYYIFEDIF